MHASAPMAWSLSLFVQQVMLLHSVQLCANVADGNKAAPACTVELGVKRHEDKRKMLVRCSPRPTEMEFGYRPGSSMHTTATKWLPCSLTKHTVSAYMTAAQYSHGGMIDATHAVAFRHPMCPSRC